MTSAQAHIQVSVCPRCDSESYTTLYSGEDRLYGTTERIFHIIECCGCNLIRIDPMPKPEELSQFYPETYWWEADSGAVSRLSELYRKFVLADHIRFAAAAAAPPGPVLDVGCGGGLFLDGMEQRGFVGFGSDVSLQAAKVCSRRFAIPAVCGSLPNLPFRAQSFGLVTMFHVLEHLHDPMGAIAAARELLPPGGRLVVQTPNAECWQMLLLGERWSGFDIPRHLINFSARDLQELLEYSGFIVHRKKYFSLRDNPAGLATSLVPSLEPVSRKVRGVKESGLSSMVKNLLYLGLVAASVPFTLLEATAAAGSSIMIEAVREGDA